MKLTIVCSNGLTASFFYDKLDMLIPYCIVPFLKTFKNESLSVSTEDGWKWDSPSHKIPETIARAETVKDVPIKLDKLVSGLTLVASPKEEEFIL